MSKVFVPTGVGDPRLYHGLERVLRPVTLEQLLITVLLAEATVDHQGLVALAMSFGEDASTAEASLDGLEDAGYMIYGEDGLTKPGPLIEHRVLRQFRTAQSSRPIWNGAWILLAFPEGIDHSGVPERVKDYLRADVFAELRKDVWIRPDNLGSGEDFLSAAVSEQLYFPCEVQIESPRSLAAELWDLEEWMEIASEFLELLSAERVEIESNPIDHVHRSWMLELAFFIHLYRDPRLPPALLPSHWPGETLWREFSTYRRFIRPFHIEAFHMPLPSV